MAQIIRKNDTVKVIAGKDKGAVGKVLQVLRKRQRVVVEGINIVKKHLKPNSARKEAPEGGIIERPAPIHVSNVALVCPSCNYAGRHRVKFAEGGIKQRICRKCNSVIK